MVSTLNSEGKSPVQLVDEFPDFDNAWPDKQKLAWFDDFIKILNLLNSLFKEKSG